LIRLLLIFLISQEQQADLVSFYKLGVAIFGYGLMTAPTLF